MTDSLSPLDAKLAAIESRARRAMQCDSSESIPVFLYGGDVFEVLHALRVSRTENQELRALLAEGVSISESSFEFGREHWRNDVRAALSKYEKAASDG